jgi:hypothetical protein
LTIRHLYFKTTEFTELEFAAIYCNKIKNFLLTWFLKVWANEFIANDYISAFERAREYLNNIIGRLDKDKRLSYLDMVWRANNQKGYITEMEATAMLKLAKDWNIEDELIEMVKK